MQLTLSLYWLTRLLPLLLLTLQSAWPVQSALTRIVVFGDDTTDTGNVYAMSRQTWPSTPPYYNGRFTNGLVWVEWLQRLMNITSSDLVNWAYGDATTDATRIPGQSGSTSPSSPQYQVPGLLQQICEGYIASEPHRPLNGTYCQWALQTPVNSSETLFAVRVGWNDYVRAAQLGRPLNDALVAQTVDAIAAGIDMLGKRAGAQRFLLITPAFVGDTPYGQQLPSATRTDLDRLVALHDTQLRDWIDNEFLPTNPNARIALLDTRSFLGQLHVQMPKLQPFNVSCLDTATGAICDDPDSYVYYDSKHFTSLVHYLFARSVYTWLTQNGWL